MAKAAKKSSPFGPLGSNWLTVYVDSPERRMLVDSLCASWEQFNDRKLSQSPPDAVVCHQIAALARAAHIDRLCEGVSYSIYEIHQEWRPRSHGRKERKTPKRLKHVLKPAEQHVLRRTERLSLDLSEYLQKFEGLGVTWWWHPENLATLKKAGAVLPELVQVLRNFYEMTDLSRGYKLKWVGPEWLIDVSFERFVLWLLWDVRIAGGRLSLDKNAGTGGLLEALKLLRPHLPPNFIPNGPPISKLAYIKALERRIDVSVAPPQYECGSLYLPPPFFSPLV